MTKHLEQSTSKQAKLMTRQNETMIQGMKDMSFAIVGAVGSLQRSVGGQPQSWQPPRFQAPFTPNVRAPLNRAGTSGQLNISHPLPKEATRTMSKSSAN